MNLTDKQEIRADAARYDASCASRRRSSERKDCIGATSGMGIGHGDAPDGRRVSQLNILLTNFCLCDCARVPGIIVAADDSPVNGAATSELLWRSQAHPPQQIHPWTAPQPT